MSDTTELVSRWSAGTPRQQTGALFGAAAQVLRRILVEHVRQRLAKKRGNGARPEDVAG